MNPFGYRLAAFVTLTLLVACATDDPTPTPESPPSASTSTSAPAPTPEREHDVVSEEVAVVTGSYVRRALEDANAASVVDQAAKPKSASPPVAMQRRLASAQYAGLNRRAGPDITRRIEPTDRENYTQFDTNDLKKVAQAPVSTFSIDVDSASYANVRRLLSSGTLPRHDAVRVEELINYFDYAYAGPKSGDGPFSVQTEVGPSPWHDQRQLLHIGIKGIEPDGDLPPSNLVFLVDVSGSMQSPDKLPLLKTSLKLLTQQLRAEDSIAIVVYAGAAGTVLEPTPGSDRAKISAALDRLTAGGSTNGGAGIRLAYALAAQQFKTGGINRIVLATDGDFNVGTVNQQALKELVEDKRKSGTGLTVLGFGGGNYNDAMMQELAQIGNGNAAYIDSVTEARKVLVDEIGSTLHTIAKDVKIQVEFNPAVVDEYRLIGYETRHLNTEDFTNDQVDAGEIGAGHTVTAIYEIALKGSGGAAIEPLRYAQQNTGDSNTLADEIAHVKLRYKNPGEDTSIPLSFPVTRASIVTHIDSTSDNYRFSAAVAAFGQVLRGGEYTGSFGFNDIDSLASNAKGNDPFGYRGAFVNLVHTAHALSTAELSQR